MELRQTANLRFSVVANDEVTATMQRVDARLGLIRKRHHRPEADSCTFTVAELEQMHAEL